MFQSCSVCAHPEHATINAALAQRVPLLKLQASFHISKSSLSRHSRKCLNRTRENKYEGRRVPIRECHQFVWWDETCPKEFQNTIPTHILNRDDYVILRVSYEPSILDDYGRYLEPWHIYETALRENKAFNSKKIPAETQPLPVVGQK